MLRNSPVSDVVSSDSEGEAAIIVDPTNAEVIDQQIKKLKAEYQAKLQQTLAEKAKEWKEKEEQLATAAQLSQEERQKLSEEAHRITTANQQLEEETKKIQAEKQELLEKAKELEEEGKRLSDEESQIQREIQKLSEETRLTLDEKQKLIVEAETIQVEKQKLMEQSKAIHDENQALKEQTKKTVAENQELRRKSQSVSAENDRLKKSIQIVQSENQQLAQDNQKMREVKYPIAAPGTVQRQFQEKIELAKKVDDNIKKQDELKKLQLINLIQKYRLRKNFLKIAAKVPSLKAKISAARKEFFENQAPLYKAMSELTSEANVKEKISVRNEREAKINELREKIKIENDRYQAVLQPLHTDYTSLLNQGRTPLLRSGKVLKQMDSTRKTLSDLLEERIKDEKKLELKIATDQQNTLQMFGGLRKSLTVTEAKAKLAAEAKAQADFFAEIQKVNPNYGLLENYLLAGANADAKLPGRNINALFDAVTNPNTESLDQNVITKVKWLAKKSNLKAKLEEKFRFNKYIEFSAGSTPLMILGVRWRVECEHVQSTLKHLISAGADIDAIDNEGNTLLHLLAKSSLNNKDGGKVLVELGANTQIANHAGQVPFYYDSRIQDWKSYRNNTNRY